AVLLRHPGDGAGGRRLPVARSRRPPRAAPAAAAARRRAARTDRRAARRIVRLTPEATAALVYSAGGDRIRAIHARPRERGARAGARRRGRAAPLAPSAGRIAHARG